MKKLLITALMVVIAWGAFAQTVDTSKIDLSKAELSLAGPDSVYVTNIYYGSTRLSVLLRYDGKSGALIYGPYYDSDKLLLDSFELGYADLRVLGNDTIIVSDLILYGQGVSGRLKYDGVATLNLASWWQTMTPTTDEMRIANLQSQLQTAKTAQKRLEEEIVATKAKYEADIAEVETEKQALEDELADLNRRIAVGIRQYESEKKALEDKLADLNGKIAVGVRQYENQIASLRRQLESAGVKVEAAPAVATAYSRPTQTVFSGFAAGTGAYGNWSATGGRLTQSNTSLYFAKYVIPGEQSADQTLYSFTAQVASNAKDFVGYGIHFYASGDKRANSYGFGNSYLVWVTRDPRFYKTEDTYVQVYRSYDDIRMLQVASVATPTRITAANDVEVLYDRANAKITVAINGVDYLTYDVPNPIRSGAKGAFRTLGGPVTFSDFSIKAK